MRIDDQPVGVLEVLNPHAGAFDTVDVELLLILAAQAAVALRNARQLAALREANERLRELDQLKTNFMSIASHELRTPLTAVQGFSQILAEEAATHLQEFVDAIQRGGRRMMNVVETIDEMAALEAPGSELLREPVALADLVHGALGDIERDVELSLPAEPTLLSADPRRLRHALACLLQNAHQFTPPDGRVSLAVERLAEHVHIRIADTGRGLGERDLGRVFEAFYQVADPDTRDHEGLGVGLTVARSVAEKHGGRLWLESPGLGHGTTAHLRLPLNGGVAG
jgi:signal transduction histidine kinase